MKIICILYLNIFILSSFSFSQFDINECELNGNIFYNNCTKYQGNCQNGKANGWGKLLLNNGDAISGLFKDNAIQDGYISYYNANKKSYTFGPNKGAALNGPCISVDHQNFVSLYNYDNGTYRGSTEDFFKLSKPVFNYNSSFCAVNQYDVTKTSCKLIPNTKNIIFTSAKEYNSKGDRKYWITVVNLAQNKVISNFGSFENPIRTATNIKPEIPLFIGFSENSKFAIFEIRGHLNDPHKYLKCNLQSGTHETITSLPNDLLKIEKFRQQLSSKFYNNFESLDKFELLNDSSYVKVFNSKVFSESTKSFNPQYGSGSIIIRFSKNHEMINSIELKNINIVDFSVNENSNRIALSYRNIDSTYLSYIDLNTFQEKSRVFAKRNIDFDNYLMGYQKYPGNVKFSKSGRFLLYSRYSRGTSIYFDNELYFGVDGDVHDFNKEENVILTSSNGSIRAFDLEKKTLIWSYALNGNSAFFNPDDDIYLISGETIKSFKMPEPILSIREFDKNPDFYKRFESISASNNNVNTSPPKTQAQNVNSTNSNGKEASSSDVERLESFFNSWIGKMMFDALSNYKIGENQQSAQSSSISNSQNKNQDGSNAIIQYVYICSAGKQDECCKAVVISAGSPSLSGCCPRSDGKGCSNGHWWNKCGQSGNRSFQCGSCGILVRTTQVPQNSCCPVRNCGGMHNWNEIR